MIDNYQLEYDISSCMFVWIPLVSVVKPGKCPPPGIGICVKLCKGDGTCPGEMKCCFNGCGHQCMSGKFINVYFYLMSHMYQ